MRYDRGVKTSVVVIFCVALTVLSSCAEPSDLELIIDLKTDYVGGAEVNMARVSLFDQEGAAVIRNTDTRLVKEDLTEGLRIGELSGLTPGDYRIEVELAGAVSVPQRVVRVSMTASFAVTVVVTRDCLEVVCPMTGAPTQTQCVGGTCVDPTCTPETPESCPAAECSSDGECSSSVACAEAACVGGVCSAGSDSSSCAIGEYCEPTMGCVIQTCTAHDDCGRCARCGGAVCEPVTFQTLAAGHQGVCAIDDVGDRWCWGNNGGSELGLGDARGTDSQPIPRRADDGGSWTAVGIGWGYGSGSGIRADGTYWRWATEGHSPEQVGTDTDWAVISVANNNRIALKTNASLWQNDEQVGTDTDWARAIAGWDHACAVKMDGSLHCWGSNASGQLGTGNMEAVDAPAQIGVDLDWVSASGGEGTSCGIKTDGRLFCWGDTYELTPMPVATDTDWSFFLYEWHHGCGIKTDGNIWCLGINRDGELGTGDMEDSTVPLPITLAGPWSRLTVGGHFTCAFREVDSRWYCWGASFGLGTGAQSDSPDPVPLCPGP